MKYDLKARLKDLILEIKQRSDTEELMAANISSNRGDSQTCASLLSSSHARKECADLLDEILNEEIE